jgi:ribosomal protein S18 acetylase RimI-like enzyme
VSQGLAEQLHENFRVHAGWIHAQLPGMTARLDPDLALVDCGMPCDTFNQVLGARLEGNAEARIAEALAFFRERGHPFSWWVAPGDRPADLPQRLEAAGLQSAESELAMAVRLSDVPSDDTDRQDLTILRARTPRMIEEFAAILAANWAPPDPDVLAFYHQATPLLLRPEAPLRLYVGFVAGQAVAAAELCVGGGVAGLYNIATLATQRGKGYGTAITRRPLLEAREEGLEVGVLQAAPDGVGIYRRLGFTEFGVVREYQP